MDGFLQFPTENMGYASGEVEGHFGVAVMGYIAGKEKGELLCKQVA